MPDAFLVHVKLLRIYLISCFMPHHVGR